MTLLFLSLLLVVLYLALALAERWRAGWKIAPARRARVGLSLFFIFTAIGHFIKTEEMAVMLPPVVPNRVEIILVTGVFELLSAIGVWIPRLRKITGLRIMLMLIGVLSANIYSAIHGVDFGGHSSGPVYWLVRIAFQIFVIGWAYFATNNRGSTSRDRDEICQTGFFSLPEFTAFSRSCHCIFPKLKSPATIHFSATLCLKRG
jgi:uncharacterized membrane protein